MTTGTSSPVAGCGPDLERGVLTCLPVLRRRAHLLQGNQGDADDLVQETVIRALYRGGFTPGTNLLSWLMRIMFNLFCDGRRDDSRRRRHAALQAEAWSTDSRGDVDWAGLGIEDVEQAALTLHPVIGQAFELACLRGRSYRDIAEQLGVATRTVGSRVHRAKVQIRRQLERLLVERRQTDDPARLMRAGAAPSTCPAPAPRSQPRRRVHRARGGRAAGCF